MSTPKSVRPFLATRGKVARADQLPLEALTTLSDYGRTVLPSLRHERLQVAILASRPTAVAEIAARGNLPLGVVRTLVVAMCDEGILSTTGTSTPHDIAMLSRVLSALKTY